MKDNRITVTDIPNTNLKKITLKNDFLEVVLLNYGARLHQLLMPNKNNHWENGAEKEGFEPSRRFPSLHP